MTDPNRAVATIAKQHLDAALQQIRGDLGGPSEATAERHQRAAYHCDRATYHEGARERLRPPSECVQCQAVYTAHRDAAEAHFRAQGQWGHPETRQADREAAAQDADRASELVRLLGIEDAWTHRGTQ